jgi:hypothetical protein
MSEQTAVEWLVEQIKEYDFSPRDNTYLIEIPSWIFKEKINKANKMFEQQIEEAWNSAYGGDSNHEGEQYYKETYQDTK